MKLSDIRIRMAKDRSYVKLSWEDGDYHKEVTIPISEYWETKNR